MKSDPDSRAPSLPEQLRCPITGKPLELDENGQWVRVVGEPLRYPVRGGIPVLVETAAEKTD